MTVTITDEAVTDGLAAFDGQNAKSASAKFLLLVNHVNNPPVIATVNGVAVASDATTVVDVITINEDAGNSFVENTKSKGVTQQTLTLAGIAPGSGDTETDETVTVSIGSVDSSSFITGVKSIRGFVAKCKIGRRYTRDKSGDTM